MILSPFFSLNEPLSELLTDYGFEKSVHFVGVSTLLWPSVTCVPVEAGLEMSPSEHSSRHLVLRASRGLPRLGSDFSCGKETARAPGDGALSNYSLLPK